MNIVPEPDEFDTGKDPASSVEYSVSPLPLRQSPFRTCGFLTSDDGETVVTVEGDNFVLGRQKSSSFVLTDATVSRQHARIVQDGRQFVVHDLNSSQGTLVNGVRIVSCRLADGDELRVGKDSVFFFDRGTLRATETQPMSASRASPLPSRSGDDMSVTFWGTRGSIPTPGAAMEKFGGNTTCMEVRCGNQRIILDAGTGLKMLSDAWQLESDGDADNEALLLLTHFHWDHIQGFPFLQQAYSPDYRIAIGGPEHPQGSIREFLRSQMLSQYFPVPMEAMRAELVFQDCRESFRAGEVTIRRTPLPHPGGSYAYRLEGSGAVFILATDCELDQIAHNQRQLENDFAAPREYTPDLLEFFFGADLIVLDCQYTDERYQDRRNWGHNSVMTTADFASQVRPRLLALTHHDPRSNDLDVSQIVEQVHRRIRPGTDSVVFGAREGMTMNVARAC